MSKVELAIDLYKKITKFSSPVFAEVLKNDGAFISILSKWNQNNVETGKKVSSQQIYLLADDLRKIQEFPTVDISQEICSSLSPCGSLKAIIRESSSSTGATKTPQQFLEVWNGHQLQLNTNLTALDIHGSVYTESDFASLVWSPSGNKIAYIAEEKVPKSEPFLPSKKTETDSSKPPPTKGEQNVLRPDWGEQMVGRHQPVIVVCDVQPAASPPSLLSGVPANLSPGQLSWTPDGAALIGVAWENNPRRLGLIYCTNRLSQIFHLTLDGDYRVLSHPGVAVQSPRCSPDGSQVVWLERTAGGPHHGCMRLMSYNFTTNKMRAVVDIVDEYELLENGDKFYGLYSNFSRRCWTDDGKHVIITSPQVDKNVPFIINVETGTLRLLDRSQPADESRSVMDVWHDVVVCVASTPTRPHYLLIGKMLNSSEKPQVSFTNLSEPPPAPEISSFVFESFILEVPAPASQGKYFNAMYMGPSSGATRSVPLIVWPHGGPHSMFICNFKSEAAFFTLLGFGVLMVNYRGSIGFGEASVTSLPGHVGDNDVADMQQAVKEALMKFPILDPEHCVLFGGSHGGFLVTHLSGQFPEMYKAVVARNPVIDIASMLCTTDIPDWTAVETGFDFEDITPRSTDQLVEMRRRSPLWHARNVKAATLLMLGSNDLRVPPSQGMLFYHELKAQGTPVKVLMYDDNHPLGKLPNDVDNTINSALWFMEHTALE